MTQANISPTEALADWEVTDEGTFKNVKTERTLSRKDWEIEIAYEFADNQDVLIFAQMLSKLALSMEDETWE